MARIRTIKPEFWRSPSTASAGPWARLLFIAMWNWADDHGRAEWTPRELLGFAFPHDSESPLTDAEFPLLLAEVRRAFEVKFYVHRDRRFYEVPSWSEHQKTEKRAGDKFPHADDPESLPDLGIPGSCEAVAESGGFTEASGGNGGAGTGEQGNRGTGEQGNRGTGEQAHAAGVLAIDPGPDLDALFDAAWEQWPKKVERKQALERFKRACRKRDPHEVAADVARFGQAYAATTDRQFVPGLGVWINGERWTDELPQPRQQAPVKQPAMNRALDEFQRLYGGETDAGTGSVRALGVGSGS